MKYISDIFPEFKIFAQLFAKESKIIASVRKMNEHFAKNPDKLDRRHVLKLRNYNLARFYYFLEQLKVISYCLNGDKDTIACVLSDMLNPYTMEELFREEYNLISLSNKNRFKLNTEVGSDGFDFFFGHYLYQFLERNVDLIDLRHCVSRFTNITDLDSIKKEVMKRYNLKINSKVAISLGSEYFRNVKDNINLFFTSELDEFYVAKKRVDSPKKKNLRVDMVKPIAELSDVSDNNDKKDENKLTQLSLIKDDKKR